MRRQSKTNIPSTSDPPIDPFHFLKEARDSVTPVCETDSVRGKLYLEVLCQAAQIALGDTDPRLSDLDRLHALFDAAVAFASFGTEPTVPPV